MAVAEAVEVDNILLVLLIFDYFVYLSLCDSSLLNSDFFIFLFVHYCSAPKPWDLLVKEIL